VAATLSGVLFAVRAVIDRTMGQPPSSDDQLVSWTKEHQIALAWSDELAVFSAVLLIPVTLALFTRFDGVRRPWVGFGCGLLAATVPLVLTLVVFQGRLMYPVYGIDVENASSIPLVASLYFGGAHVLALMLAAALAMLGISLRSDLGEPMAVLSVLTAVGQVAASYPWLIGADLVLACQLLVATWIIVVGLRLLQEYRSAGFAMRG
jgi:hypothetical protein